MAECSQLISPLIRPFHSALEGCVKPVCFWSKHAVEKLKEMLGLTRGLTPH